MRAKSSHAGLGSQPNQGVTLQNLDLEISADHAKFMVIETFKPNCRDLAYERFHQQGRLLPPGLHYLDSWLEANGNRCFQLMETSDVALFDQWIAHWEDLVSFEVIELGEKPQLWADRRV